MVLGVLGFAIIIVSMLKKSGNTEETKIIHERIDKLHKKIDKINDIVVENANKISYIYGKLNGKDLK